MIPFVLRCALIGFALFSLTATTRAQEEMPLGDVARQQRELRRGTKKALSHRSYSNVEGEHDLASTPSADVETPPSRPTRAESPSDMRSALDRPLDPNDNITTIPAGTRIRVNIAKGLVLSNVQLGNVVPISAGSAVTLRPGRVCFVSNPCFPVNYPYICDGVNNPYSGPLICKDGVQLDTIVVDERSYHAESEPILPEKTLYTEQGTFILTKPISILPASKRASPIR